MLETAIPNLINSREEGLQRARGIIGALKSRALIGVCGQPGAGKSTFTEYLANNLPREIVCVVPMDGFHLSNAILEEKKLREIKGAPITFDVHGFADLLGRIRNTPNQNIYYPVFDRSVEESIAAQGLVSPEAKLIIVEGNYLCHDQDGWENILGLLDETWYLQIAEEVRRRRLIDRHIQFGKSPDAAREWALGTDEINAALIAQSASRADFIVKLDEGK